MTFSFFTTYSQTTYNFDGLGTNDSGGTNYKTINNITNFVVSNNLNHFSTEIYGSGATGSTETYTIKGDGINVGTFDVYDINIYSFITNTFDVGTQIEFIDSNGFSIQTMSLNSSKSLSSAGVISISGFFDNEITLPINAVAEIRFTIATSGSNSPANFTLTSISLDNINPPSTNNAPSANSTIITGNFSYGETLVGSYNYLDIDGDPENSSTYQWYVSDNSAGTLNKQAIAGATEITYEISANEIGKYISFEVTPYDGIDYGNASESNFNGIITSKELTISGLTGNNKVYDKTNVASASGTPTLNGVINNDNVTLNGTGFFTFNSVDVGQDIIISMSGYSLSGSDALNYYINFTNLEADINRRTLSITGITASNKTYDGTTTATVQGSGELVGVLTGDDINLNGTPVANFDSKNVGNNKIVHVINYAITGSNVFNYSLTQPNLTANVFPKEVTISGLSGSDKTYDKTTLANVIGTPELNGIETGDEVNLETDTNFYFTNENVDSDIPIIVSGYNLTGMDSYNYNLTQPNYLTANITPKPINISGLIGIDKIYDSFISASYSGTPQLNGIETGDDVFLIGSGISVFENKNIGDNKTINVSGFALWGDDVDNYILEPVFLSGNITPRSLTLSGLTVNDKEYDGTTEAQILGVALLEEIADGDDVQLSNDYSFVFSDHNANTNISVLPEVLNLVGDDANNYTLEPISLNGNITPRSLILSGLSANNKVYDATTDVEISGVALLEEIVEGDDITLVNNYSFVFSDFNVGNNISVIPEILNLEGDDAHNYSIVTPSLTANITLKRLTFNGISVTDKVYDGKNIANIEGELNLIGVEGSDIIELSGTPTYTFSSTEIDTNIPINIEGYVITGDAASNYYLDYPNIYANITDETPEISLIINLSPNPVVDIANINSNLPVLNVTIFDLNGQLVYQSNEVDLNLESLVPGTYILKVKVAGQSEGLKFIKL